MLSLLLVPLGLLVSPMHQHTPAVMRPQQIVSRAAQPVIPLSRAASVFPSESVATTYLIADAPEEDADAKGKGRLIFGVIVANSIFWQYILPIFKGQPTATGRKKTK